MKIRIYLSVAIALVISACTTGSYVSTSYVDDIYFNPGDVPPPVALEETTQQEADANLKSADRLIISEIRDNEEGSKTMNNYIFDEQDAGEYVDAQLYNMDQMQLEGSDTTIYYDDNEVKYVINNYYDGSDVDFSYRINRFHRPYSRFYDPFYWDNWYWDSWYYPYSSLSWSWGWGYDPWSWGYSPYYSSWYGGMYGMYGMYSPYYSPYSYMGWGGGWGYPYYNNYWGGGYYIDSENYRYGQRREYNTMVAGGGGSYRTGTSALAGDRSSLKSTQSRTGSAVAGSTDSRRARSVSGADNGGRAVREGTAIQNRTITEMRRGTTDAATRSRGTETTVTRGTVSSQNGQSGTVTRRVTTQGQYTRPAATVKEGATRSTQSNAYTPSYNQQRTTNRSNYNVPAYSRPATTTQQSESGQMKSGQERTTTVYSRPSSSSSSDRTYRSTSTYNRSSSSGTSTRSTYSAPSNSGSYSSPSRSTSSPSYSSPSRSSSSSSGSYSGGGSSSGGSSSSSGSSSGRSGRR